MNFIEYRQLRATDIAALVNRRSVSAVAVVEAALARLADVEDQLRAFRDTWPDQARHTAHQLDMAIAVGARLPLAGVPLAVKAWEGTTSVQATRLIRAGCVPIGATAVPTSGTRWQTWGHTERGTTVNPWRSDRSPGGSSAGSAVAVAAGVVPIATASDGAGSTRIPAAWCGVIGVKPTTGRLPARDAAGLSIGGPIAGTVTDAAAYLDVVLGTDMSCQCPKATPMTATWSTDLGYADVDPEVAAIARTAANELARAGHIEWRDQPVRLCDPAPAWSALRIPDADHQSAQLLRAHNDEQLRRAFGAVDLVLTPTTPHTAHAHDGPGTAMNVALTWAFNLSGHPAITVPAGFASDGTPVGLQLVARHEHEADLINAARSARPVPRCDDSVSPR